MNDEQLTLYYFNDGLSERERRDVESKLGEDEVLAARYERLVSELDSIRDDVIEAPSHMKAQWHDLIDAAPGDAVKSPRAGFHFSSFFWGAAVTAALALGIGIGNWLERPDNQNLSPVAAIDTLDPELVSRGVRVHLIDSRRTLDEANAADQAERLMIVGRMIEQNRMLQHLAADHEADDLARVLRAMEPVLVQLGSSELSDEDATALRAQLIFEMNVVLTKLGDKPSEVAGTI